MRKVVSFLTITVFFLWVSVAWGNCPEDPNDRGTCDTLYVEPHKYINLGSFPADVEVALRVTHDVPGPLADSLQGLAIPLCYTSTNPAANASIDPNKNKCGFNDLKPNPDSILENSIFRHLPSMADPQEHNWMMDLSAATMDLEWDTRILDLTTQSNIFWLSVVVTGTADQRYQEGSRVLWATMTITIDDTTTICVDSCFWPPSGRLQFSNGDATVFIPRHNMPVCFNADTGGTGVREIPGSDDTRPKEFSLSQNYPNPFNPSTNIEFNLPKAAHVKIDIFNIVGQRVRTLVDEEMEFGNYVVDWDGKDENAHWVSSGIYFYRMKAEDFSDIKKMLLVK